MKEILFEVAWEVVNKVGGIYTVIRSKAPTMVGKYGKNFFMLGTYNPTYASTDIELKEPPGGIIKEAISSMSLCGVKIYYGKWLIDGYPNIILFDLLSFYKMIDGWRLELSEKSHIHIPPDDREGSDVLVFGGAVAWFLGEFTKRVKKNTYVIGQFHEWLSGVGLIFSRIRNLNIALIFTTHATLLGRHLAAANQDLYNNLRNFNNDKEAGDRKIYHIYCIERASAHCAHVFTTVSKITGDEAEAFLTRKPDITTPNGLNVVKYTALHEFQNLHAKAKEKINKFVAGHFSGHCDFDFDKTLYFFSAGRYEYTNKGVNLFLESLARLNHYIKWFNVDVTIVVFLIFPTATNTYNVESLKGQALYKQLNETIVDIKDKIGLKLMDSVLKGIIPEKQNFIDNEDLVRLKRFIIGSKKSTWPPICTHNVINDSTDPILCELRKLNLLNSPEDKVKVIFHPEFLSSSSPLFPIDYEEFVRGCHLGVFSSYYEPWGYTPAECTVMGIPSVTSNLSGFGQYIYQVLPNSDNFGIYIVDRRFQVWEDQASQLTEFMLSFARQDRRHRILQRNRTERLSELLDWKILEKYYAKARSMALHKIEPSLFPYSYHNEENSQSEIQSSLSKELRRTLSINTITNESSGLSFDDSSKSD